MIGKIVVGNEHRDEDCGRKVVCGGNKRSTGFLALEEESSLSESEEEEEKSGFRKGKQTRICASTTTLMPTRL